MLTAAQCLDRAYKANLVGDFDKGDRWAALARNLIAGEERVLTTGDPNQFVLGASIIIDADIEEGFLQSTWWS